MLTMENLDKGKYNKNYPLSHHPELTTAYLSFIFFYTISKKKKKFFFFANGENNFQLSNYCQFREILN